MRISELSAHIVRLRLRKEFKHASFTRRFSDNLIIRCKLENGMVGWGEGVPREYVTGESPRGALAQLAATDLEQQLQANCLDWPDVFRLCENYRPQIAREDTRGCMANAHRCAVELSILDAFGKLFGDPLRKITSLYAPAESVRGESDRVQYSSAISSGGIAKEMRSSLAMRLYGFRQCKVKVGMRPDQDPDRLRRMRRWVGSRMDLRVDVNEAWKVPEVVERIGELEPYGISCVEQPVRHDEVAALSEIRDQVNVPLMLDESLTSETDAALAIRTGTCDLFNIRLSKCGGFLSSLRLAAMARGAGLGYQLGCHPGESSILSAAGRHFITSVDFIRYREGSFDRHLLKDFIADRDVTFGRGGWAPAIESPGLGININEFKLQPLILETQSFKIV
jgi:muconate cycloisomerase